jgi:hypothetical protein
MNIHYLERPFRCHSCSVSFRTKGHLQKHERSASHHNKVGGGRVVSEPSLSLVVLVVVVPRFVLVGAAAFQVRRLQHCISNTRTFGETFALENAHHEVGMSREDTFRVVRGVGKV